MGGELLLCRATLSKSQSKEQGRDDVGHLHLSAPKIPKVGRDGDVITCPAIRSTKI
jgi:hypothetical protein